jgi:hypothetical protein
MFLNNFMFCASFPLKTRESLDSEGSIVLSLSKKSQYRTLAILGSLNFNKLQVIGNRKNPFFRVVRQARYISNPLCILKS